MKLKNTLGLFICSLSGGIREDRPVVKLCWEITGFPRSWILQVVVGGWIVHRLTIDYVESDRATNSLITRAPDWFLNRKHHPNDRDGVNYIGPKLTRNGRGAVPVIASGHSSMTTDCRPRVAQMVKLADNNQFFNERFDIGQLPVRMIQSDVDSWIYDVNQPLPYQIPAQDFLAQQLKGREGGIRRGELVMLSAFSHNEHKVDLTKHYFAKG